MLGVCYYPEHWSEDRWVRDAERMAALGLKFARIGEFAWAKIEPEPGTYCWDWLDRAIEVLAAQGLEVMLGTPTATPPKWLIDQHNDILAWDREGRPRGFGSRRHYCFSSDTYRREAGRITALMAQRYGNHPAVTQWQTDNEFGCHDTVRSYSPMARDAFRIWLEERYRTIDQLKEAWGTVFWSQSYRGFGEVELPNLTTTEANPSHWLDFFRFSSAQVIRFHKAQADIIRQHAPKAIITHNAMGHSYDFDHHALGKDVDILTWDSYPLGFLSQSRSSQDRKLAYLRQGDPDFAGFHHDLYRGCARFGVIEQQPGPVNWAPDNPAPLPGMVGLWCTEVLAHEGEYASIFRWRQAPFAQEQNHAGLLRPDDQPAAAYGEVENLGQVLPFVTGEVHQSPIAMIFDYETQWMSEIQPQGSGWNYGDIFMSWYRAFRKYGHDIDILPPGCDLDGYQVVAIPSLFHVSDGMRDALERTGAQLLIGPRSGSKDENGNIPHGLAPGPLRALIDLTVARSETVPEGAGETCALGSWRVWRDEIETDLKPQLSDDMGYGVLFRQDRTRLFAALPDADLVLSVAGDVLRDAALSSELLPVGLRLRRRGQTQFAFNYSQAAREIPSRMIEDDTAFLIGSRIVPPASFAAWKVGTSD